MDENEVMVKWADAVNLANQIRAERDAAHRLLRELQRNLQGLNALTPAHITAFKAVTACELIDRFLDAVDRCNAKAAETSGEEAE